jgi:hypothetical protein
MEVAKFAQLKVGFKEHAGWVAREIIKPYLGPASLLIGPTLLIWIKAGATYFGTDHKFPGWCVAIAATLALVGVVAIVYRVWHRIRSQRPKWYTWNDADWQLMPEFFAAGYRLRPEYETNLAPYVRGPVCRKPECKREMTMEDLGTPNGFAHALARCSCNLQPVQFDFQRMITGISPLRAVLLGALTEAQAAARRREKFRDQQ